jgi:hypothetical protein
MARLFVDVGPIPDPLQAAAVALFRIILVGKIHEPVEVDAATGSEDDQHQGFWS